MKTRILLLTACLAAGVLLPTEAEAAKGKGKRGARTEERVAARLLGRFDRNRDKSLDGTEAKRVRMAFKALKALDTDNNGELSDSEISTAKIEPPRRKRGAKRARKGG